MFTPPTDDTPYYPFQVAGNFEFMEVALVASLNQVQVDKLLDLISCVAQGTAQVTLKNNVELHKACDAAAAQPMPFCKHDVTTLYKKEMLMYEVFMHPVWEWALDLLQNELLAPYFVWDAQCVYKYSGKVFKHFYDEPWTADHWWDIQSSLPDVGNAIPFGLIIHANKTKLSSFGTAKGYPVVVQCANLLVEIWNSHVIGGGCVVGWLSYALTPLQVPEDAQEEGRLGYTNLKQTVWHESFVKLLDDIAHYSQTGYSHTSSYNNCVASHVWIFVHLLLTIRWHTCKCPCPVCLVPIDQLHNLTKTYPPHLMDQAQDSLSTYDYSHMEGEELLKALGLQPIENIFWWIRDSDPHVALSFDHLHALQHISNFPRWHGLSHFKNTLNVTFSDGNKKCNLAKEIFYACLDVLTKDKAPEGYCLLHVLASYLELDSLIGLDVHMEKTIEMIEAELLRFSGALKGYIECIERSGLDGLQTDWNFPKAHLWQHISMHGPLKEAYECQSNGRDTASQILCVNKHQLAAKLLRMHIDHHMNWSQVQAQGSDSGLDLEETDGDDPRAFEGHTYLSSPCKPTTMQNIETDCSQTDSAFVDFRKKLSNFCNQCLVSYGYQVQKWIVIPPGLEIREYKYLKVNYESLVDWKLNTNHLQCNPMFHGAPQYDCAVVQLTKVDVAFVHLISIFSCKIPDVCSIDLALMHPFAAKMGASH
ncbi:hypothetical protein EDD17DRAFT_1778697 [Pisolithus thermaeus]|nr:hypothetical protein EV401DRAFT_2061039 [Pisolithus croceorrhizus]KAI6159879.1 hypothetical protein EDD17DRAFT_1778697 [Pisolithus thermaeus]